MEALQKAHGVEELVIVADAGMLLTTNLTVLDEARLRFIARGPHHAGPGGPSSPLPPEGDALADGQITGRHHPQTRRQLQGPGRGRRGRAGAIQFAPEHPAAHAPAATGPVQTQDGSSMCQCQKS